MTNVVSMGRTCEYLVSRAARHRRAGRYDEAMILLTKARTQFGFSEEIELECARIYDEIGCEDEAFRSYLRIVRAGEKHKAEALFQLSLSSAQRGDITRAVSYYQQFAAMKQEAVSQEMSELLGRQLLEEIDTPVTRSLKARARRLERRAALCMQQGRTAAARRAIEHAIALRPTAENYTLLACCNLLRDETQEAVQHAEMAHRLSPSRVQALCVLADALIASGEEKQARRAIYLAAMRARSADDLLAAAIESAKYGEDLLTLRLTAALLRREPFSTRAMLLRACALTNRGRLKDASRLFGRICGLLPQDTVCEYYYRMTQESHIVGGRLGLGLDVPREEGIARAKMLISLLYVDPGTLCEDASKMRGIIRLCDWAIHSPMAGSHTKTTALIILSALESAESRMLLEDLLTEAGIADSMKMAVLQILTAKEGFRPYLVDIGGQLVRLAAGGVSAQPMKGGEANSRIVQRAADAVAGEFPDAPQKMLEMYLEYLGRYGQPKKREEAALAAALEYAYHAGAGRSAHLKAIALKNGVSRRLCAFYTRRLLSHQE